MEVTTTKFGTIRVQESDLLHFEYGLIGFESCNRWILLADRENHALGWLQCVDRSEVAIGIVSPRLFVPDYQLRIVSSDLSNLSSDVSLPGKQVSNPLQDYQVVVIVSRQPVGLSINLKAPLIIDVQTREGCQVVCRDDYPVRYPLSDAHEENLSKERRKIA